MVDNVNENLYNLFFETIGDDTENIDFRLLNKMPKYSIPFFITQHNDFSPLDDEYIRGFIARHEKIENPPRVAVADGYIPFDTAVWFATFNSRVVSSVARHFSIPQRDILFCVGKMQNAAEYFNQNKPKHERIVRGMHVKTYTAVLKNEI